MAAAEASGQRGGWATRLTSPGILKACAWCGVAGLVIMVIGFMGLAHFVPPPSPADDAQGTARFFADHRDGIRLGMILTMGAAALFMPFLSAISVQMRRIEGRHSPLAWVQLGLGAIFVLEFIYLCFFWQAATFRADRGPELVELLNDMAWIPFVGLSATLVIESAVYGLVVLRDQRPRPIFPRWLGYYNLWAAVMFMPGTFNVFFHTGALAWNGLLAFYIPVVVFVTWLIVNSIYLAKAVDHQVAEEAAEPAASANGNGHGEAGDLAAEVVRLRAELDRVNRRLGVF